MTDTLQRAREPADATPVPESCVLGVFGLIANRSDTRFRPLAYRHRDCRQIMALPTPPKTP
jgi:hypothetical protein